MSEARNIVYNQLCLMKNQDPSLAHLNSMCEQIIYETYYQQQPDQVEEIESLIRKGHSPTDIENFVRSVTPKTSQVADHVYLVASYLLRNQIFQN